LHDCDDTAGDRRLSQRHASEGCGTIWVEGDQRLGYDAETGALVAAEASLPMPVVQPCFTAQVSAGAAALDSACTTHSDCDCNDPYDVGPSTVCNGTDWFERLSSRFPDLTPEGLPIEPRPDTQPENPSIEANGCHFEYLGDWISCQDPVGPWLEERLEGASFDECLSACLARSDCSAVLDYHWLEPPDLGCYLFVSSCDSPTSGAWQEEDGARYYRKVCSAD